MQQHTFDLHICTHLGHFSHLNQMKKKPKHDFNIKICIVMIFSWQLNTFPRKLSVPYVFFFPVSSAECSLNITHTN